MRVSELKELGPPFPAAEVQVSDKKRIARLVLVLKNPSLDFPFPANVSAKETVDEILKAARAAGLIDDSTTIDIVDLDSFKAN